MREIKFRAWVRGEKKMRIPHEVHPNFGKPQIKCYGIYHEKLLNCNQFILMQYTGLKDKNGKDIYEGDVVDKLYSFGENKRGVVSFGEYSNELEYEDNDAGYGWYIKTADKEKIESLWEGDKYLILGNIYENPELL